MISPDNVNQKNMHNVFSEFYQLYFYIFIRQQP